MSIRPPCRVIAATPGVGATPLAMAEGPERGLAWIERPAERDELRGDHLPPAVRAELLHRLGRRREAGLRYAEALALVRSPAERRDLERRLAECRD